MSYEEAAIRLVWQWFGKWYDQLLDDMLKTAALSMLILMLVEVL